MNKNDIVPENRKRWEELDKKNPRTPEEEQEYQTLSSGQLNQNIRNNQAGKNK